MAGECGISGSLDHVPHTVAPGSLIAYTALGPSATIEVATQMCRRLHYSLEEEDSVTSCICYSELNLIIGIDRSAQRAIALDFRSIGSKYNETTDTPLVLSHASQYHSRIAIRGQVEKRAIVYTGNDAIADR